MAHLVKLVICLSSIMAVTLCHHHHRDHRDHRQNCTEYHTTSTHNTHRHCTDPSETELRRQMDEYERNWKMHNITVNLPHFQKALTHTGNQHETEYSLYGTDDSCPEVTGPGDWTCPAYYALNVDKTRYPRALYYTKCRSCTRCRDMPDNNRARCEPVTRVIPVLRRAHRCTEEGVHVYSQGWHRLPVGCSCTFREAGEQPEL